MKKIKPLIIILVTLLSPNSFSQNATLGEIVNLDLEQLTNTINSNSTSSAAFVISLPMPNGSFESFNVRNSSIMANQPADIQTLAGTSVDSKAQIRVAITSSGLSGIMHYANAYYIIEVVDKKEGIYTIYNMNDSGLGSCGTNDSDNKPLVNAQGKVLSAGLFPVGTQLRKYKFAGSATGEMVVALGSQTLAKNKIVEIMNATNLIYELEAAVTFEVIAKTTDLTLMFPAGGSDPFNVNTSFGDAGDAQTGFDAMANAAGGQAYSGILPYTDYDMGHTFHVYSTGGGARGTGGGSPCDDASKSVGWTEFGTASSTGLIVGLFAHEVGHQFSMWHTYNATGGAGTSPTFCTGGWSNTASVEPGSGTTLMGYGRNCSNDTNGGLSSYVLTNPNNESYFNAKSLDQMFTKMAGVSSCFTSTATGNSAPVVSVGAAPTIPKGTPFMLTGSATDANEGNSLSYNWSQIDSAVPNDQGALGSINGIGGYNAVNSTTAPLFRSRIGSSPSRTFPAMNFILNNANDPADNEGEDLPQVARTMNFRLTVRDNATGGGGVDSEALVVTVSSTGPFEVSSNNTASTIASGATVPLTWNVNGTQALSANVKISMSIDGLSYPFVLEPSTPNDGNQTVTIPVNFPATSTARIKISSIGGNGFEWFDVNNANLTITSACAAVVSYICPITSVSANAGDASFNLGLTNFSGSELPSKTFNTNFAGQSSRTILVNNAALNGCQTDGSANSVILPFQVTSSGTYTLGFDNFVGMTIISSSTVSCASFVGSSITADVDPNQGSSYSGNMSANLNVCTTYYLIVYNVFVEASVAVNLSGPGEIIEVSNSPAGFSYTYAAINNTSGNIDAVSATSNFTALGGGTFTVKGLMYANALNPATLVGGTEAAAYATGSCILFSGNSKTLNITGIPCPSSLTHVSTANDFTSGTQTFQTSNTTGTGLITATNDITGGNTTYDAGKKIEMNPGFSVTGGVFTAQIGGCN